MVRVAASGVVLETTAPSRVVVRGSAVAASRAVGVVFVEVFTASVATAVVF